jgi:hypothetical protein
MASPVVSLSCAVGSGGELICDFYSSIKSILSTYLKIRKYVKEWGKLCLKKDFITMQNKYLKHN